MCVEYVVLFEACGHKLMRPNFMFWCPAQRALLDASVGVDSDLIPLCENLERREHTFPLHCHQCMLSAVISNKRAPGRLLLIGDYPERRSEAERILRIAQSPPEATDHIFYDETTGRAHEYSNNVQLFQVFFSTKDFIWLARMVLDITAVILGRWESDKQPNPILEEVTLLVQMSEAYIGSNIQNLHDMNKLIARADQILLKQLTEQKS